jgi:hypothetical protein
MRLDGLFEQNILPKYPKAADIGSLSLPWRNIIADTVISLQGSTFSSLVVAGVLTAAGGVLVTGGSFAAGKLYVDAGEGLALAAATGSARDFNLFNPAGTASILNVPTGTNNVVISNGALFVGPYYSVLAATGRIVQAYGSQHFWQDAAAASTNMSFTFGGTINGLTNCLALGTSNTTRLVILSGGQITTYAPTITTGLSANMIGMPNGSAIKFLSALADNHIGGIWQYDTGVIANNGVVDLSANLPTTHVVIFIMRDDGNGVARFYLRGGINTTAELEDLSAVFSTVFDTASSTNIYYSSGYKLQNKTGGSMRYVISANGSF